MEKNASGSPVSAIGRRSFLKGSAAVLGLTALSATGCAPEPALKEDSEPESAPEEIHYGGVCSSGCHQYCRLDVVVRDGKIVKTGPAPELSDDVRFVCTKGRSNLQRVYGDRRLKYPMRRIEGTPRGGGAWEQITWDEAIQEITDTWKREQEECGNSSVVMGRAGGGPINSEVEQYTLLRKLIGASRLVIGDDNIIDQRVGEVFCYANNPASTMQHSKTVVLWGSNVAVAYPPNWMWISKAKKAGAKLVSIGVNFDATAAKCDEFISIRPATDAALAMAMINVCVENGWQDLERVRNATVAPFLVKESDAHFLRTSDLREPGAEEADACIVMGADGAWGTPDEVADPLVSGTFEVEGHKVTTAYDLLLARCAEWPVERAAEVCGIPEETIVHLAELYKDPTWTQPGFGPNMYDNGSGAYMAIFALSGATGNVCKMGSGYYLAGSGGACSLGSCTKPPIEVEAAPHIPYAALEEVFETGELYGEKVTPKSMFLYCWNPLNSIPDHDHMVSLLDRFELFVAVDVEETETTQYADIVLPASYWFEQEALISSGGSGSIALVEKAIEPLYESKPDYEIAWLLAEAMGVREHMPQDVDEVIRMQMAGSTLEQNGIDLDYMREHKVFENRLPEDFVYGKDAPLPTPTGRFQFYVEDPDNCYAFTGDDYVSGDWRSVVDVSKERLPFWEPPREAWSESVGGFEANEQAAKYPLRITTERSRYKNHSQYSYCGWLLELDAEPVIRINPATAEPRGIKDEDLVRVFNDRGECVGKCRLSEGVRPGQILFIHGWRDDQYVKGSFNRLNNGGSKPQMYNHNHYEGLAEIEVYEGSVE